MIRANVMEAMNEDYVRTARAKGAPEWKVLLSHVLRNALLPVVTMLGMDVSVALGGAVFTESVYGLPGLGRTTILALAGQQGYDLPVILAVTLVAATAIIILNLVADLLLLAVDPTVARRTGRGVLRSVGRAA